MARFNNFISRWKKRFGKQTPIKHRKLRVLKRTNTSGQSLAFGQIFGLPKMRRILTTEELLQALNENALRAPNQEIAQQVVKIKKQFEQSKIGYEAAIEQLRRWIKEAQKREEQIAQGTAKKSEWSSLPVSTKLETLQITDYNQETAQCHAPKYTDSRQAPPKQKMPIRRPRRKTTIQISPLPAEPLARMNIGGRRLVKTSERGWILERQPASTRPMKRWIANPIRQPPRLVKTEEGYQLRTPERVMVTFPYTAPQIVKDIYPGTNETITNPRYAGPERPVVRSAKPGEEGLTELQRKKKMESR